MAETPSSPDATITELDDDSLAQCTNYLNLRDISNMAMTCKFFKRVAYSDSVWHRLFSEKWPKLVTSGSSQSSTVRGAYLARHTAVQQFKAMLWDMRKSQEQHKPEPWAELEGHVGPVKHVHADPYKIVTGSPYDFNALIWDTETGARTNSLSCCNPERPETFRGCACVAVDGSRVATVSSCEGGLLRFRDFADASRGAVSSYEDDEADSKFWRIKLNSDSEPEEYSPAPRFSPN